MKNWLKDLLLGCVYGGWAALLFIITLMVSEPARSAECEALNTDVTATLAWRRPTEREDGNALTTNDIGGYIVYKHNTANNTKCEVTINDNLVESFDIELKPDVLYNVKMKTFDTGNRLSAFSNNVTKIVSLDVLLPAKINDLVITRVSDDVFSFNFSKITTFDDGSSFPDGLQAKYYLFDADGWVRDVDYNDVPFELTLTKNIHGFYTETSVNINNIETVSNQSDIITVDNDTVIIKPPKTFTIRFVVPDGFVPVVEMMPE